MSPKALVPSSLPSPWAEFLGELDKMLARPVELHCLGGFVLKVLYGFERPTADIDYIAAFPSEDVGVIQAIAGPGSELAKKYRVHVQYVTVAEVPENYEARLQEMAPGRFTNLRLLALDLHDLVLAKLARNHPRDDADVQFLIRRGLLDPVALRERYERELRPNLANQQRHDTTLRLWLDYF